MAVKKCTESCPFCHGPVQPTDDALGKGYNFGSAALADISFSVILLGALALGSWYSVLALVVLLPACVLAWHWWSRSITTYRCKACQTVVTHDELHRHGQS